MRLTTLLSAIVRAWGQLTETHPWTAEVAVQRISAFLGRKTCTSFARDRVSKIAVFATKMPVLIGVLEGLPLEAHQLSSMNQGRRVLPTVFSIVKRHSWSSADSAISDNLFK